MTQIRANVKSKSHKYDTFDTSHYIDTWLNRYRPGNGRAWFIRALLILFKDDPVVRRQFCKKFYKL